MRKDAIGIEALKHNNDIVTEPVDKVEALAKEYESVFVNENLETIPNILPSPHPDMEEFQISKLRV